MMRLSVRQYGATLVLALILMLPLITAESAVASGDSWATMAPIPKAVVGHGVAVVDGKIFVVGGADYDTWVVNTTWQYDPASDTWVSRAAMPTARSNFGIAVYNGKIYCIGGDAGTDRPAPTAVNEVYDPTTNSWETKAPMPTARYDLAANVVDGKIYLAGGFDFVGPYCLNVTEVYDPVTDTWITKAQMPIGVMSYASAVVDSKIYIISGRVYTKTSGYDCNLTQIYNPATDAWVYGAAVPEAVTYAGAASTTGAITPKRIYIIGGRQGLDAVNFTQIYDPKTNSWTTGTPMPTTRCRFTMAAIDDQLYAIGGLTGWFQALTIANEQYTPSNYSTSTFPLWIALPLIAAALLIVGVVFKKRNSSTK